MKSRSNIFLKLLAVVFVVFCSVTIIKMQFEFNDLKEDKIRLEQQIKAKRLSIDELSSQLSEQFDRDNIMRIARDKFNYRLPNELIFYNDVQK